MNNDQNNLNEKLEEIKRSIANGFLAVDKRFDELDDRVGLIEKEIRTTKLELLDKLASIDRVDQIELRVQELESSN